MRVLIKNAIIIDDESEFNGQSKDILIENGLISCIQDSIQEKADEIVEGDNLHVSIGWFDLRTRFCDPGEEFKEDLNSGLALAESGGFTGVGVVSNTKPAISSKAQVQYLLNKGAMSAVEIYPLGTVTEEAKGEQLAEMYDMSVAGAKAFCDDNPLNSGILYRALLYTNNFNSTVFDLANDKSLSGKGQINEGKYSVMTGLKGVPTIAELIRVKRNIELLKYTNGKLHLTSLSSRDAIDEIKKYKESNDNLTSDVSIHHLNFIDADMEDFDSNLKIFPPFRSESDKEALKKAVLNGDIECVTSDHNPQDKESKDLEFDLAEFGIIGIQTFFSQIIDVFGSSDYKNVLNSFTKNPRRILGLEIPGIKEGEMANLTVFDPSLSWKYEGANNRSLSKNSPILNSDRVGKAIAIFNKGHLSIQK